MLRLPRNLLMEVHKVLRLPRNLHMELYKVLRLPRNLHMEVHKVLPRNLHVKKQVKTLIAMEERTGDHRRPPPTTQQPEPLTEHGGSQSAIPATNSGDVSVCHKVLRLPRNLHHGGCSKVLSFFQAFREAFASFRTWGFTTVGDNGFSLGLEAFQDSCSCPGTSCVL